MQTPLRQSQREQRERSGERRQRLKLPHLVDERVRLLCSNNCCLFLSLVLERHASASLISFPSTPVSRSAITTPPPTPPTPLPFHVRARALLRATCDDAVDMPARDDERAIIRDFITGFVVASPRDSDDVDHPSCLYISGAPGTGKTALVNSILRSLDNDIEVITINCMALSNLDALWERLHEKFKGTKKASNQTKKAKRGKDAVETLLNGLLTKWYECPQHFFSSAHLVPQPLGVGRIGPHSYGTSVIGDSVLSSHRQSLRYTCHWHR